MTRWAILLVLLGAAAHAQEDELPIPRPEDQGDEPLGLAQDEFPVDALLSDPPDEPTKAERLIDEEEAHLKRLRQLQRRAEIQAAERDVQKAVAETEQAKADAEKARTAGKPPAPKLRELKGVRAPLAAAPLLVGVTAEAAVLDYAGAIHTVSTHQRVNGWLVREVGFDYVVLEGPAGVIRRQELGW